MNCDKAFDLLTEPAAAASAALSAHLARCPRCRQMQQTLSPALEWLQTRATEPLGDGPAWNHGSPLLTAEAVQIAAEVARALPQSSQARYDALRRALGLALVALFGMALGIFVVGKRDDAGNQAGAATAILPAAAATCLWARHDRASALAETAAQSVVDSCIACHVPALLR